MNTMNVAFINHTQQQCGVYQYGKRMSDILKKDSRFSFYYIECDTYQEFSSKIDGLEIDYLVYNWHCLTMGWLSNEITTSFKDKTKQLLIFHESTHPDHLFLDGLIMTDLSEDESLNQFSIPRPIYEIDIPKTKNDKIKFGSFGFGFDNKGFERICGLINENYNDVIIHLHITNAFFGDTDKSISNSVIHRCEVLMEGSSNELIVTTEFYDNDDILKFLNDNSVNIFLYDDMYGRGLSSVIDYAVSVNTPLIVNNSSMFRHLISDKPNISINNSDLQTIINNGIEGVLHFRNKWSHSNLNDKFVEILNKI